MITVERLRRACFQAANEGSYWQAERRAYCLTGAVTCGCAIEAQVMRPVGAGYALVTLWPRNPGTLRVITATWGVAPYPTKPVTIIVS